MSLPVSASDLVMLIQGLWKLSSILRHDAVDDFRRCAKTYREFAKVAFDMCQLIDNNPTLQDNKFLRDRRRGVERVLYKYFKQIQEFKPHLGDGRVRGTFHAALAKFQWVRRTGTLKDLQRDLEFRLTILSPFVASLRPMPSPRSVGEGGHFVLDDARCEPRAVYFSHTPNWDHFQQLLTEQIFPRGDAGHNAIKFKSYVLHNLSTSQYIFPGSPSIQLLTEAIHPDNRVEMSVIVPWEDSDANSCPRCEADQESTSSVDKYCQECDLRFRFFDAVDDQPDPLTQLALDGLRQTGLRKFVSDFLKDLDKNSLLASGRTSWGLTSQISPRVLSPEELADPWPELAALSQRWAVIHFRRIAVCTPRWPNGQLEQHRANERAKQKLQTAMKRVERLLAYLERSDIPLEAVGKAIGSRVGGRTEPLQQLLRSLRAQYRSRLGPDSQHRRLANVLDIHGRCAQGSAYQFQPSVVKVRCLLWIFSRVLTLEANVLSGCSAGLAPLGRSNDEEYKTGFLFKAYSCLFIPHVFAVRLSFDVVGDVVGCFVTRRPPPPLLGAIFRILQDSRGLCLDYVLDGSLRDCNLDLPRSNVFSEAALAREGSKSGWLKSYRQCVESVMESEGGDLRAVDEIRSFIVNDL